jgi:hypothetical protein
VETFTRLILTTVLGGLLALPAVGETPATDLLARYANSYDTDPLLEEPFVAAELEALLGNRLPELHRNLGVRGPADVISGYLVLAGLRPHHGGEEEAIVCVAADGRDVHAGIFSRGRITLFSRAGSYMNVPLCLKDWSTQVNSGHRDRLRQPANVQLVAPTATAP